MSRGGGGVRLVLKSLDCDTASFPPFFSKPMKLALRIVAILLGKEDPQLHPDPINLHRVPQLHMFNDFFEGPIGLTRLWRPRSIATDAAM
jgi:hypothetical protein